MWYILGGKRRTVHGATTDVTIGDVANSREEALQAIADYMADGCVELELFDPDFTPVALDLDKIAA